MPRHFPDSVAVVVRPVRILVLNRGKDFVQVKVVHVADLQGVVLIEFLHSDVVGATILCPWCYWSRKFEVF